MRTAKRRVLAAIAGTLLVGAGTAAVLAQDEALGGKLRGGDSVIVPATETVSGDLYVFAGSVSILGTVGGDLVAAGGEVNIDGTVGGDVLAAGGSVVVGGDVMGDARLAGGQLSLNGGIGEDAALAGGQVSLRAGASVGGDVIASAGQLTVDGSIGGSITGAAGEYTRRGTVGGTDEVSIREEGPEPAEETAFEQITDAIRQFLVVLLVGAAGLWLLPRALHAAEVEVRERPLVAFAAGILACIGYLVFVVATALVVILAGIALAALGFDDLAAIDFVGGVIAISGLTFALVVAAAFVVDAIVGLAVGRLIGRGYATSRSRELGILALGAAIVVILTSLPAIGGLLKLVVVLLGLGALLLAVWAARRRPGTPVVAATA